MSGERGRGRYDFISDGVCAPEEHLEGNVWDRLPHPPEPVPGTLWGLRVSVCVDIIQGGQGTTSWRKRMATSNVAPPQFSIEYKSGTCHQQKSGTRK